MDLNMDEHHRTIHNGVWQCACHALYPTNSWTCPDDLRTVLAARDDETTLSAARRVVAHTAHLEATIDEQRREIDDLTVFTQTARDACVMSNDEDESVIITRLLNENNALRAERNALTDAAMTPTATSARYHTPAVEFGELVEELVNVSRSVHEWPNDAFLDVLKAHSAVLAERNAFADELRAIRDDGRRTTGAI